MKSNFEKLCKWLDKETELFTVSELHGKMCSIIEKDLNISSLKWMKKHLDDPGCSSVVCFTVMISTILSEQWYKDRKDYCHGKSN